MLILKYVGVFLCIMYGASSLLGGFVQIKKKRIPLWSTFCMILISILIIWLSLIVFNHIKILSLLVLSLLSMQILAIVNGFHMYGKIHYKHHIIRLCLSMIILLLFLNK